MEYVYLALSLALGINCLLVTWMVLSRTHKHFRRLRAERRTGREMARRYGLK